MRAKVVIPVLGFAIVLAGLVGFGLFTPAPTPPDTGQVAVSPSPAPAIPLPPPPHHRAAGPRPAEIPIQPEMDPVASEEQRIEDSGRRIAELRDLAAAKEDGSLGAILSELSNPDVEVRRAALDATVEFGDRGAIPALQGAMESNPDPQEKVNIQKGITFLQLPTLTELNQGLQTAIQPAVPSGAGE